MAEARPTAEPAPIAPPPAWRIARWIEHPFGPMRFRVAAGLAASVIPPAICVFARNENLAHLCAVALLLWGPFAALGTLWYAVSGVYEVKFRLPRLRRQADRWARPWTWEHKFGTDVELSTSSDGSASILVALLSGALAAAVLPGSTGRGLFVGIAVALFAVLALVRGISMTASRGVHLTWGRAVLPAGVPLTLRFGTLPGGGRVEQARLTLRVYDERGQGSSIRRLFAKHHLVWSESRALDAEALPVPGSDVEITFAPPPHLPGTCLAAPLPCFWEVELQLRIGGTLSGGGLTRRVILPVYVIDENLDSSD